ncbi:MFS transporter [Streptomyces noursei]|uniref:MFS transporter n=1 Tax=Streptomyces noursei TaxID=1971 RepID=UPI00081C460E|nr:arabinose efflux permease family protein [Streptomyces noursei ATCC 11455]MCZ0996554.1 MFS transporter [Streptomyces noursei]
MSDTNSALANDSVRNVAGYQRLQRRILAVLAGAQVLGGIGVGTGVAVSSVTAASLSGSDTVGGLAQTSWVLGAAVLSVPAARLAASHGRRPALVLTYGLGALGGLIAVLGTAAQMWPLLIAGLLLFGGGTTAGLAARFAATDLSTPARAGRDLSAVVWATTIGSVAGPNLGGPADQVGRHIGMPAGTGPFLLAALAFGLAALSILAGLRPDPLHTAARVPAAPATRGALGSAWKVLCSSPKSRMAVTAIVISHVTMVALMTMTPVHLHHGNATVTMVGVVISLHIGGMYALSPLVGWLSDRIGTVPVLVASMVQFLAAAVLAGSASPHDLVQLSAGLVLLGTGWSFGLVAGSALLTASVQAEHRPAVQGISDLLMNAGAGLGGIIAGTIVATASYSTLAAATAVIVTPMTITLLRARSRGSRLGI